MNRLGSGMETLKTVEEKTLPEGYRMTELGPLPEDWKVVRLGEVAKFMKAGGTPKRGEPRFWGGNIPFVLIEDLTSCELYLSKTKETITEEGLKQSSAWIVPPGSLLLSMYATIGETAINTIPVATNQAILAIIPKDNFHVEFGAYLLKYHSRRLVRDNVQSTQKNVNKGIVQKFLIPLPPLPEQKAIAQVLKSVQEAKEKTEEVIKALKEFKKSLMRHLFTYGPVPVNETDRVEIRETEIGPLPAHWKVVRLGEVVNKFQYGISKRGEKKGSFPIIRMNNLQDGRVVAYPLQYVNLSEEEFVRFRLEKRDILFNRTNSFELVGKTALFELEGDYVFASYLIRLKVSTKYIEPHFLNYLLNWEKTQNRLKRLASRAVSQANISASKLREFKIPLPPLPEQQQIAHILQAVDRRIEAEENRKQALEDLFRSLLHNLMTAKIRLPKEFINRFAENE